MGYAYDDRWPRMTAGEFLKRRFIRLHPLVVLGALISAPLFYFPGCPVWAVSWIALGALASAPRINALPIPAPLGLELRCA